MTNGNWLKTNWLALCIIGGILGVGIAWGTSSTKLNSTVAEVKRLETVKMDKEMFQMYAQQQAEIATDIKTTIKEQRVEQRADMKEIKDLFKNGR